MERTDSVAVDVARAVAAVDGVDPAALRPPLADVVDPTALELLFETDGAAPTVEFEYRDHEVTVLAPGRVRVDGAPAETSAREAQHGELGTE